MPRCGCRELDQGWQAVACISPQPCCPDQRLREGQRCCPASCTVSARAAPHQSALARSAAAHVQQHGKSGASRRAARHLHALSARGPQVHSNYGNPAYTCLYRLRMHGIPVRELGAESQASPRPELL